MRALISIAIIATVLFAANKTWKNIEHDYQQKQMVEAAKSHIDKLNSTINSRLANASNPFTASPAAAAQEAPAATISSNPTPKILCVTPGKNWNEWYPDQEQTILAAK